MSKAEWNFNGDGDFDRGLDSVELVDAKLHSKFSDKASLTIKDKVVTVQFNEESKALDHAKVVEVTLKVQDDQYTLVAAINPIVSVMDANNQTSSVLKSGYSWKVNPQFSMGVEVMSLRKDLKMKMVLLQRKGIGARLAVQ